MHWDWRMNRNIDRRLKRPAVATLLVGALLSGVCQASKDELSAREIIAKATESAGGDAWRYAQTIHLKGHARLFRGGNYAGIEADQYEMRRIYPRSLGDANTGTGKFRLDAYRNGQLLFQSAFDGQRMYDQRGPMPEEAGANMAASSFGFSAIRFALSDGFELQRLADDQVEGYPCHFVRVIDPSGGKTLFAIDQADASIRLVAWDSPQGWHHRIYSDFYWVEDPGFRQPGRVRLYYDGIKAADIRWTTAVINSPIDEAVFQIGEKASE